MKKINKKTVRSAMIGAVIGLMMSIVFSKSSNVLTFIPIATIAGGLLAYLIEKRKKKANKMEK
jgi:uncharacterized membrane protein YjjB (DUF3815 family)